MLFLEKREKREARTMLSLASDFWPLFWTVIGIGAALTVLLCIVVATSEPDWTERSEPATVHHLPRPHLPKAHHRKAA
jgi:hypothetical protein